MHTEMVKDKAKLAGFSKVLGSDSSQFIFLSRETDGRAGRKILINGDLAPVFAALVNETEENLIMHQLKQLSSIAGGLTGYSNIGNAFEHIHVVDNLKIAYKIVQLSGSSSPAGIYITDIGFADFGKGNSPGVHHVDHTPSGWEMDKNISDNILTKNAAINGLCENKQHAAENIMPDMVEQAYGNRDGIGSIQNEGYSLFYNPQSQASFGKSWKTPEQKSYNEKFTADLLSKVMLGSQMNKEKVQWSIHGDGCRLFGETIKKLAGQTLDNHEVIFLSPSDDADIQGILSDMRKSNIGLHKDVMKVNDDDWSGSQNRTIIKSRSIANEVKKFGSDYELSAEVIASKGISNSISALGWLKLAGTGGIGVFLKLKALRNMLAQGAQVTDTAVNPHFHPFKDKEQFNAHAKINTDNKAGQVVFTELLKRLRG